MTPPIEIFDRRAVRRHRDRAASHWPSHDFLVREATDRMIDRLTAINRNFPLALDLGCHGGTVAERLQGIKGVQKVIQADLSPAMARRAQANGHPALAADEEFLPFAPASFDLVMSMLSLHWVNDLPGALLQIRQVLKPDGLFLAVMPGGDSLIELRMALLSAESEIEGGTSPRVSPFAQLLDAAGLLQRAGFALPVADLEELTITYADLLALLHELRSMGESNAVTERQRKPLRRGTLLRAQEIYAQQYAGADQRLRATVQLICMAGWAPHDSQQQPARPGSARHRLAEALETRELSTGALIPPRRKG